LWGQSVAVKQVSGSTNVLEAAQQRILNVFNSNLFVVVSTSGGKDSIVLSNLVLDLIRKGKIDPKQMEVQFVDEEAMHDEVIEVVEKQRKVFLAEGVKFNWYCIQVKHFNCFNSLSNDESFITWDQYKKDVWVRPMPKWAIRTHPMLKERIDTYQDFLERINVNKIAMIGIRAAESVQRLQNLANVAHTVDQNQKMINIGKSFPIYDWADSDVWLYIKENNLTLPKTYMNLYQIGEARNKLRLSQFFSIDTARVLVGLNEYDPGLMEKVIRREPNAYLASLYWGTELFKKQSTKYNKKNEALEQKPKKEINYKKEVLKMIANPNKFFKDSQVKARTAFGIRRLVSRANMHMVDKHWKRAYEILIVGDPKERDIRALYTIVYSDYSKNMKKELAQ